MFVAPHSTNKLRSLDYNKIKVQYVFSLPITFSNDIIFELLPIRFPTCHFGQMQGMDYKYDGNVWCKVKTSNMNNNFGLGLRSIKWLGHLHCDNDSCEHFFHFVAWNKVSWIGDSPWIPLVGQFAPRPYVGIVVCKFCVASPFCVNTYPYHIYYVIHKLQSLSIAAIHLGTHEHHVAEGMCGSLWKKSRFW